MSGKSIHCQTLTTKEDQGSSLAVFGALASLIMFIGLAVGYLVTVNSTATKGYRMRELESQVAELKTQSAKLHSEVAVLRSIDRIREQVAALGLVSADQVEYLSLKPKVVASAK